ncbi:Protein of uncharacterised function (DUF1365) [Brevundimonas diminuta]|uniref:DUF1365 domain-containing protein n=1 Tax=Brevundimonas diminuta TaxID=293 RepID=UPI000207E8F0|nr:DUF1365 family protein [Brevundimonas diminuta]EGF96494.1 hypothetical protein BDIM_02990 [Brevundimonas diminuta ATCC 11568]MBI2249925.1 DUF1365 family protein [Brevundimonas diminuta]OWR16314.1 DUF1365 domain-containing protein [Brevundimonas diminuta]WQE44508.1 DUF1365 family protein [Brevundimonas diminuta]SPU47529.1 Protein of uncharacterised function (DUF1365) [Brevundimonas diminuta]
MTQASALYRGGVTHRRLRRRDHRLNYRVFWLLLDLAEIDGLDRRLRLFSRNRFNLLSFHDRDHGDGSGAALRPQIEAWLERAGVALEGGPIRLLTMPRVLGYVFNPISLYYCHRADGRLAAVIYEVTSTFGVRHAYVIPVPVEDQAEGLIRQSAAKALYVSPFMGMEMDYEFRGHAPGERLDLTIDGVDSGGVLITAAMSGERHDLTDADLLSAAVALPFLTLKVVAAIHWEALKLWLKRVPLTRQPPPAWEPVTIQKQARESRLGR